jgi:energy-coupling factor transporter transmembrane protein EcfT
MIEGESEMTERLEDERPGEREEFKLHPAIRWVVGGAIYLWVLILFALLWQPVQIPGRTYLSALFFIALFSSVLIFYNGLTIVADRYGVTYRGLVSFRNYPYETIMKLDVRPGLTGILSYDVITRRGMLQFSSFIANHRRLMELIVERADLENRGRVTGV